MATPTIIIAIPSTRLIYTETILGTAAIKSAKRIPAMPYQ